MKISVNGCVYRTENLPDELKANPDFKKAIEKAEKRKAELEAMKAVDIDEIIPVITKGEYFIPKKHVKNNKVED